MAGKGVHAELDDLVRLQHLASGFTFLPRQRITSLLSGRHASRLRGRGLNFEEIRGYRPGDDTRNMDWKATARLRKPQVRVYTEERDRPAILVVDQRMSMFFGSRNKMKSVVAAEAAALAAWRVVDQGDRVGAIVFGDEELSFVRPRRSAKTVIHILKEILRLNHALRVERDVAENPGMFNKALERAARAATHDHLVCVISDFAGMDLESERWFKKIAAHNDVIAVGVSDPIGRLLPRAGRLAFERGGLQLEVDTSAHGVQDRFQQRFDESVGELRAFLRRLEVPLLTLTAEGEVIDQVRAQIGRMRGAPR